MITKVNGSYVKLVLYCGYQIEPCCHNIFVIVILDLLQRVLQEEKPFRFREVTVKPNDKDYQTVQNHARPDSSYIRETFDESKSKFPKPLPPRSQRSQSLNIESQGTAVNGFKRSHDVETADVLPGITPCKKAKPDPTPNLSFVNGSTSMATESRKGNY